MYLTEEELLRLFIIKMPDKSPPDNVDTYVSGTVDMKSAVVCFTTASVDPKFVRLFQAAPVMFQTCYQYVGYFERFAKLFAEANMPECAAELDNMKVAMKLLLGAAVDGLETTQQRLAELHRLQIAQPEGKSN